MVIPVELWEIGIKEHSQAISCIGWSTYWVTCGVNPGGLLVQCRSATYRMNTMFSLLYRAGAFLSEQECSFVSEQGLQFLKTYSMLAGRMFGGQQTVDVSPVSEATYVSPSGCWRSGFLAIPWKQQSVRWCSHARWMKILLEEVPGSGRRVNIRRVSLRTLDRYLVSAYAAHAKAGLLV